ncbi:MAG: hypothetical protein RIC35_20570 [Marinoscillum sp.]
MTALKQLTKDFLLKTFDIREGEYQRVLLMQLNIFLIIFTLLIIKPVVNAQFISMMGVEQLPMVFVLVAISSMVISTVYARALSSKSLQRVSSSTLVISIIGFIGIAILLQLQIAEHFILYLLYIGVAIFGVLATSQFWIMANLAFDSREAKRLFSFIGVGPIAGGVAGGYLTSLLASYIEGINLLYVAAFLLCFCIPLNNIIWKKHIRPLNTFQQKKRLTDFTDHPIWLIGKSKHLTYLALIVGLSVIVSKLVEYQFSSAASRVFDDPDDLTSFFGFWFSTFNVISLLIQLFLVKRIVGTFGVGVSLFALPGGIMVGSILLLFAPVLWAGIFTKLWEVSVKQSVNKSATELLSLPIPTSIKSQMKSFIDVFVDLSATGIAGLLLIFLVNGMDLSVRAVSILTLAILGIWIWVAIKVRQEYINSFKAKLTQADKDAGRELPDFKNTSVLNGLRRVLDNGTENQIIYVLNKVREISDHRLFDNVVKFLTHDSSKVRISALECVYFLGKTIDGQVLENLLSDPDHEVRYRAFTQLLRQTSEGRIQMINHYLRDPDPMISGAALVGLAGEARNNPEMQKRLEIETRIHEKMDYLQLTNDQTEQYHYKLMILRAIGQAKVSSLYNQIYNYLEDTDPRIRLEAIYAAGYTMSEEFIEKIAAFLVTKSTRPTAQQALLHFGTGIIPELLALAEQESTKVEIIHQIPAVLEKIDSPHSVKALLQLLGMPDVNLRLEVLRSLNTVQRDFAHLKIRKELVLDHLIDETNLYKTILGVFYKQNQMLPKESPQKVVAARTGLIQLLERRLDGTLERIFRLIGLRYPPDDVISAYQGIKSVNESIRSNSVEYLDNLLEPSLKKVLVPIAENAVLDYISKETINTLKVTVPDERQCFTLLLQGRDARLKIAVFELLAALEVAEYVDLVHPFTKSPNDRVRSKAEEVVVALERI